MKTAVKIYVSGFFFFLCTLQKCVHVACIDFGVILYMHRPIHSSFSWLFLNSKGVIQSIQ